MPVFFCPAKPPVSLAINFISFERLFAPGYPPYWEHMDNGMWTFKCRKCNRAFEISLSKRQQALDFAKDKRCPGCGSVPSEASRAEAMRGDRWHEIIGFRMKKPTVPFAL